ncbi:MULTISPECIES: TetR family transcriptional regulator [Stappiaceae]|uniref:TetR/AcrR family transcriptional regulator n=1 Tax=Stappiaceae TaxID=2821832 RepID=UPI0003B906A4|nr:MULTISPECIES: TetR family transcriptional regulator [Stappiaceae]ERP96914.1 TetR family transcriptional regulator [Labrenzia sp. C1B10]ERS04541.1 TetR family transcriptional regulator [Labrenzia sp. C1B70]MBO6860565.1 TetR family transcriptional regulator [Roseibium sp.]
MRPSKRDELVRKSLAVFYRDGFHATGMDTLVAETGISKTTMFKHFRTKDDLILAVLRYRDETFRNWFLRRLDERDLSPKQKLLAVFDILKEWFEEPGFKGCMFIKASAEFQDPVHPAYAQSTEHKRLLLSALRSLAEKAGAREADLLARQILLLKEGAIVAAQMGFDPDPSGAAKNAAAVLIDAHIPEN